MWLSVNCTKPKKHMYILSKIHKPFECWLGQVDLHFDYIVFDQNRTYEIGVLGLLYSTKIETNLLLYNSFCPNVQIHHQR